MANYNIVAESSFTPFTFEELLKPAMMATEAHQQQQEAYDALATEAALWGVKANQQTDENTYNQYKQYADNLQRQADLLASQGLTPQSRTALSQMKKDFATQITPIQKAYEAREADIKRQQAIADKTGGRTVFTRDARTTSLDEYLDNTVTDFYQTNLDKVLEESSAGAKGISSRYRKIGYGKAFGNDYYTMTEVMGIPGGMAIEELRKSGKYKDLDAFIKETLRKEGINEDTGESIYNREDTQKVIDSVYQGILSGLVYDEKTDFKENWREKMTAQEAAANRKTKYEEDIKAGRINPDGTPRLPYTMIDRVTVGDQTNTSKLQSDIDFLKQVLQDPSILDQKPQSYNVRASYLGPTGNKYYSSGVSGPLLDNRQRFNKVMEQYSQYLPQVYKEEIPRVQQAFGLYSAPDYMQYIKQQGLNNKQKIENTISLMEEDLIGTAIKDRLYGTNYTSNIPLNNYLKDRISIMADDKGTPIYSIEKDGKKGSKLNKEELENLNINWDTGYTVLDTELDNGFVFTYEDTKDKKTHKVFIDVSAYAYGDELKQLFSQLKQAKENKDWKSQNRTVAQIMSYLQETHLNQTPVQGNTSTKAQEEASYFNYLINNNE